MITLRAYFEEGGKGIFEQNGTLFHIEPPYDLTSQTFIDEKSLEMAIINGEYKEEEKVFADIANGIDFLIANHQNWLGSTSEQIPDAEILKDLPVEFIQVFIDKLEAELLSGNYRFVLSVSSILMEGNKLEGSNSGIANQINVIMKRAHKLIEEKVHKALKIFSNIISDDLRSQVVYAARVEDISLVVRNAREANTHEYA